MKYRFKNNRLSETISWPLRLLLIVLFFCMLGCTKYDQLYSMQEGQIYMPQAYQDRSLLEIYKVDSTQTFYFGAALAGFNFASKDIKVSFEIDTTLIRQYNEDNDVLNFHYVALPEETYAISGLSAVIKKGGSFSSPLTLSIQAKKLETGIDYVLPVRITQISDGLLDTAMSITYFRIDSLLIRSRDLTSNVKLSVSNDNAGGPEGKQGSSWVIDNDFTSKFFCPEFNSNFWIQLLLPGAEKLDAYTLTSANDRVDRDPRNWKFQGSIDGASWVTLDERQDYSFANRLETVTFELNQPDDKEYTYYRLLITDNNGGGNQFQLAEFRLLQYY